MRTHWSVAVTSLFKYAEGVNIFALRCVCLTFTHFLQISSSWENPVRFVHPTVLSLATFSVKFTTFHCACQNLGFLQEMTETEVKLNITRDSFDVPCHQTQGKFFEKFAFLSLSLLNCLSVSVTRDLFWVLATILSRWSFLLVITALSQISENYQYLEGFAWSTAFYCFNIHLFKPKVRLVGCISPWRHRFSSIALQWT